MGPQKKWGKKIMSNIGKKPIQLKEGVNLKLEGEKVIVSGPKGDLEMKIPYGIITEIKDNEIKLKKTAEEKALNRNLGLARALLANIIIGVTDGFEKKLELSGVGYRARVDGEELILNVGFTEPVRVKAPAGIKFNVYENIIAVSGVNKELVGDVASNIRKVRVPDPYKAKGIKYVGEYIRRKVGKAAKAVGGK